MRQSFQQAIALLDQGFAIYRHNIGAFLLIAFGWFVPTAIMVGLVTAASSWLNSMVELAIVLAISLLALPLTIYLIVGLSRVADDAIAERPINLRAALALHPLRAIGMSVFTVIFSILTQIITGVLVMVCVCPIYVVGLFGIGLLSSVSSSSSGSMALGFAAIGIFFGGAYLLVLVVGGAGYSSLVYALQPWALERLRFGEAIQRSLDLVGYRFRSNSIVWGLAAILLAAAGLSVAIVIGLLIPLPTIWLLGESSLIAQAVTVAAWLAALVFVLPPLPIWMALLYRRNMLARSGADLVARIDAWEQGVVPSEGIAQQG
ncbi:MAG: hypothetical protein SH847_02615 [Roseiflexaceae bacterium]|nr:hypothetical protein [Roseiflexaceae bacterium]